MRSRNLVLGSAAGFAMAAAFLVTPSFAQTSPRDSTPAEQAETDRLNALQASEPAIIVSPAREQNAADIAAYNAVVAEANARAQAQYDAQLKDYQDKNSAYQAEKRGYQQQLDSYRDRTVTYDDHAAVYESDSRAVLAFPADRPALVALDDIVDPDRELGGTPVEDRTGYRVGHFRHLTFQDAGRQRAVIALRNKKNIVVDDVHLRFDPEHETVVADLTFDELNSMPARF